MGITFDTQVKTALYICHRNEALGAFNVYSLLYISLLKARYLITRCKELDLVQGEIHS